MFHDPFYDTPRWKRLRAQALRRDGYTCQLSKRYGRLAQATTVHHIFPREEYPEYQWELWNLLSVSTEMHDRLHNRQSNQLSAEGERLRLRTAANYGLRGVGNRCRPPTLSASAETL